MKSRLPDWLAVGFVALVLTGCPPYGDAWMQFGGQVSDRTGGAVRGVAVELWVNGKSPARDARVTSDVDGKYRFFTFSCPCDFEVEVVATAPGYKTFRKKFRGHEANRLERLDIVLDADIGGARS